MKAIVVTDEAAGTGGMTLVERSEPLAAINDVIVENHASGFVPTEMAWPSTWTDRAAVTEHRRSRGTSWPEWSAPSGTGRRGYPTCGVAGATCGGAGAVAGVVALRTVRRRVAKRQAPVGFSIGVLRS